MRSWLLSFRLARRELRGGLKGFRIFLACLIIGVGAIAAVQSVSSGLIDSLRYSGRYLLGGDIAIRTIYQPITKEQKDFLQHIAPVSMVANTKAMARNAAGDISTLVELKAVDPFYPLYSGMRLTDEGGKRIDDPRHTQKSVQDLLFAGAPGFAGENAKLWGALADADFLSRMGVHVSDVVYLGTLPLQIRGVIAHEPDKVGTFRFSLGPRLMISTMALPLTGLAQKGSQIYYDHRILLSPKMDVRAVERKIEDEFPGAEWRIRDYMNASPSVERYIKQFNLFLTLVGLTALLVGGVGVSNAVRSYMEGRMRTIATLKCLGAPAALVFRSYLIQVAIIATGGIGIALLIGAAAPFAIGPLLTEKLSIENRMDIYPQKLMLAACFGWLVAFAFSLWPLARASDVPPADLFRQLVAPAFRRPALKYLVWIVILGELLALLAVMSSEDRPFAAWFVGGSFATVCVFLLAAQAARFFAKMFAGVKNANLRLALANIYRPGNATGSIILSLGLGISVLVTIAMVQGSFSQNIRQSLQAQAPSFFFLDIQPYQLEDFKKAVEATPSARKLEITPSLRGQIVGIKGMKAQDALIDPKESWLLSSDRGFTYTDKLPAYSEIVSGKWWDENYQGPPLVSVSQDVAQGFDAKVGDDITVNILGRNITAKIANVRNVEWDSFAMNFAVTFAPGALENAPKTFLATVVLDETQESALQQKLARDFPSITSVRVREALQAAVSMLKSVAQAMRIAAAVALVSGTLVLAGAVAAGHKRRIYDAVILKVLGATRRRIMAVFLLEYGVLGLVTAVIACGIGTLAAWAVFAYIMRVQWVFGAATMISTALISAGITLALGFAGTALALRQKAAPLLRNE